MKQHQAESGRDEDGHLSCCDEDVLHSPLRCFAVLPTPLLCYVVALSAALQCGDGRATDGGGGDGSYIETYALAKGARQCTVYKSYTLIAIWYMKSTPL